MVGPEQITLNVHMQAKPGKHEELLAVLMHLLALTRPEQGCINYELHRSTQDSSRFMFYENWAGQALLKTHIASDHIKNFIKVSAPLLAGPMDRTDWRKLD